MKPDKCILVFDDDLSIVSILRYIFEERGWNLINYADCFDVIEKIRLHQPAIIMMDNKIDPFGGVVATESIKSEKHLQDIPLIFFSASDDVKVLSIKAGADTFLAKPFDLTRLCELIEKVAPGQPEEN
ncbi:MAG: response regulator [Sphingobacteriaceae bacterium]